MIAVFCAKFFGERLSRMVHYKHCISRWLVWTISQISEKIAVLFFVYYVYDGTHADRCINLWQFLIIHGRGVCASFIIQKFLCTLQ